MSHPITTFDNTPGAVFSLWLEAASEKGDCQSYITGMPLPRIAHDRPTSISLTALTAVFILTVYGDPGPNNEDNSPCFHILYTQKYKGASGEGSKVLAWVASHY